MNNFASICILLLAIFSTSQAGEFADALRKCRLLENQELNNCLRQIMESLRPRMKTGIPELNLPPLDPFKLDAFTFTQREGNVVVNAKFNNVKVRGVSDFKTNYIRVNPTTLTLEVDLNLPRLLINGNYTMDGKLFLLDIVGQGPFYSVLDGITAHGVGTVSANNQNKLKISNVLVDFKVLKMNTLLENLFDGTNPILAETINVFVNENGHEILSEIQPEVARQINQLVDKVMNDAFSQIPADTILVNTQG